MGHSGVDFGGVDNLLSTMDRIRNEMVDIISQLTHQIRPMLDANLDGNAKDQILRDIDRVAPATEQSIEELVNKISTGIHDDIQDAIDSDNAIQQQIESV